MSSTTPVHIVNLSTALRDRLEEPDGDCQMSFAEVANVSSFRVVSAAIPLSSYTFSDLNNKFTWAYSVPALFAQGDYFSLRLDRMSTFGSNSRVLTYRETVTGVSGFVRFEKTVTINDIFYTDIQDILDQINVPPAEAPAGFIRWNSTTNKLYLDVPAVGDGVLVELICDCLDVLGVSPRLATVSIYDGPVIVEEAAQGTVNLEAKVAASNINGWYPPQFTATVPVDDIVQAIAETFNSTGYLTSDSNTKPGPWISGVYQPGPPEGITLQTDNTNFRWTITGITPNMTNVTGLTAGVLPHVLVNVGVTPTTQSQITTSVIDNTRTQPGGWSEDQVVTFATDVLYLEATLLSTLNTAPSFAATGAVWSASHNRLVLTTGENFAIRFNGNVVLGIQSQDWIVVPRQTVWSSRTVYDLSGGQDVFYVGCPDLYSHGRSSQGVGANSVRRRDIVVSIANTTTASFGSYLHYYDQSGLFIPLGRSRSVTTLRIILYNQRFEPVNTNGIPVHVTIELV